VLVLAVESATDTAGVALADEDGILGSVVVARGRRHTESIAPAIDTLRRRTGLSLADVDVVGVDVGPGLFTGLRVGVGTAKALAFALDVPVVTATSLEVLAHAVASSGATDGRLLVPVVDARRGEVFSARFRAGPVPLTDGTPDAVWAPEALAADLAAAGPLVLVGDGARRYREVFGTLPQAVVAGPGWGAPPVGALAELCVARAGAGLTHDGASVMPRYLRQADAKINWEQRRPPRSAAAAGDRR
jgi:tRNA threonylcarbamoyladenosine biosynthesis protein TsaB